MPDDINELDVTDAGLKGIFGERFHDETQKEPQKDIFKKETTTSYVKKVSPKTHEVYKEGNWQPTKDPNWLDKLKGSAMWACGFGSLSFLVFYWQQADLMDSSIAIPTMCLFTALAGFGIGKNARCK